MSADLKYLLSDSLEKKSADPRVRAEEFGLYALSFASTIMKGSYLSLKMISRIEDGFGV